MSNWKSKLQDLAGEIDYFSGNLRAKLRRIGDFNEDLMIVPYLGYGTADFLSVDFNNLAISLFSQSKKCHKTDADGVVVLLQKFLAQGDYLMKTKLEREVRFLKIYAFVMMLGCAVFLLTAFAVQEKKQKFKEIDVERINIVEKDGKLRMVVSNAERQHPGITDGKTLVRENGRPAGMIFFNEKGDEVGGLTFTGNTGKGQYNILTFDKFRGDQTIAFQHFENSEGNYFAGLSFNDENTTTVQRTDKVAAIKKLPDEAARKAALKEMRDKGEFLVNRLVIGRGRDKSALLEMSDAAGKRRISMTVGANGTPKLEFFDETGKVIYSLPEAAKTDKK